ncbi:MAG: hypothetical protein Q7V58_04970 [Actinomycetota bacterium]|nr:hypothetical protein [Actinomycetota bacterium]
MTQRPVGGAARPYRGVVHVDVGWTSMPSLLRSLRPGTETWYLRSRMRSRAGRALLAVVGARQVDLDIVDDLPVGPESTEGPMLRAMAALDLADLTPLTDWFARDFPLAVNASGMLRSRIHQALAERALDAFYAELWSRARGFHETVFVGSTPWDRLLLTDAARGMTEAGAASRALAALAALVPRRRQHGSVQPAAGSAVDAPATPDISSPGPDQPHGLPEVLLVLNQGRSYGALYAYDHVMSPDPRSPLHPGRMAVMARTGGPSNPEGIAHGYPGIGSRRGRTRDSLKRAWSARRHTGRRYAWAYVHLLAKTCAIAAVQRPELETTFPSVRVAVLAYELQVPVALVLALEAAGVRTVALNERPLSVVIATQPFAMSCLLTASAYFSERALGSTGIAVARAEAVGMWRTDFLRGFSGDSAVGAAATARAKGRKFVVVLPYHHVAGAGLVGNPLATSRSSVRHFLTEMLELAVERPDLHLVIRGKNADWLVDPQFADLATRCAEIDNVEVSTEYSRMNESYRLVAKADLVIAKYTSLVDEALAIGIPCVVHDYTTNARGVARAVVEYLPEQVWATSRPELLSRIDDALVRDGDAFRESWEPIRHRVFGTLNDGSVRERARAAITRLVSSPD